MAAPRHSRHLLAIALATLLSAQVAAAGSNVAVEQAPLRSPQVPVQGNSLQAYFDYVYEPIVVGRDQIVGELLGTTVASFTTFTMQIELGATDGHVSGIYDGYLPSPTLVPVFPANAAAGWFASISFRVSPLRVGVNLFDSNAALVSSTTTLGFDRSGIGFYVEGASGPVFSQDARNAGGAAQLLFYAGTGLNIGSVWLAAESERVATADRDYDDVVWFVEAVVPCVHCESRSYLTPTLRTTWGGLKARFR